MKRTVPVVLICLLMSAILAACGPSQAERDAQATNVAAETSAGQTSEAPASTPTLTPTSTPTATPTPGSTARATPTATSTSAPMPTLLPSLPAGWREHSASGFHIALPDQWEAVDVGEEGIEAVLKSLEGMNPEWAQDVATMFSAGTMQETIEFWAMDSEPAGIGHAVTSISHQPQPFPVPIDFLCALMPSISKQMGFEVVDAECGLRINDLDAARFVTNLQMGSMPFKQYLYTYVREGSIWTLSLSVDETEWSQYEPLFADIAESFRVD